MLTTQLLALSAVSITALALSRDLPQSPTYRLEQPLQANLDNNPLFSLHRDLININSVSGNEQAVGSLLESYLQSHNYTVERQYIESEPPALDQPKPLASSTKKSKRFNLFAYPGTSRRTRILLTSHVDTVPPFYGYTLRSHDEIWGRGSVDAKACIATQLAALQELLARQEISRNDAALLFVVDEETGGAGMLKANELDLSWETVIFGEPTELKLASGHKGIVILTVKAHGRAGHSGYPWLGASANHILIPALAKLMDMKLPWSEKYGNSTLNIGLMDGGVAANVIAETASAKIGIRIAEGDPAVVRELVLDTVKGVDERLEVEFNGGSYGPVYIDSDVVGFENITVNYGTDIPNLKGRHKRYLYGPGSILVAHSDHEHLKAGDLLAAVEGYKRLIKAALKL